MSRIKEAPVLKKVSVIMLTPSSNVKVVDRAFENYCFSEKSVHIQRVAARKDPDQQSRNANAASRNRQSVDYSPTERKIVYLKHCTFDAPAAKP